MSSLASSDINIIGSIEQYNYTAKGENHHCCAWRIDRIFSYISKGEFKSPQFTIYNGVECKWNLSLQSAYVNDTKTDYNSFIRLVLDREQSDCEIVAKFKLFVLNKRQIQECNLQSSKSFKFVSKSENSAGILFSIQKNDLDIDFLNHQHYLKIICEVMIEQIIPKNDDKLSKDLGTLLRNQSLTDVVISVGGKTFSVHKAVLAARSSVFAAMFSHDMVESRGMVRITDMDEDVVEKMLHYVYTGKVANFEDQAISLFMAADKYDLDELRSKCEEFLIATLSNSNVLEVLLVAESCSVKILKSETINFISVKRAELIKTPAWESICGNNQLLQEIAEAVLNARLLQLSQNSIDWF